MATFGDANEKDAIKKRVEELKIPFTIALGSAFPGVSSGMVPNGIVIGPDGRFLHQFRADKFFPYRGYDDFAVMKDKIESAAMRNPRIDIDPAKCGDVKADAEQALHKRHLGEVVARLQTHESKKQAEKVLKAVGDYVQKRIDASLKEIETRPCAVVPGLKALQAMVKGCDLEETVAQAISEAEKLEDLPTALELEKQLFDAEMALLFFNQTATAAKSSNKGEADKAAKDLPALREKLMEAAKALKAARDEHKKLAYCKKLDDFLKAVSAGLAKAPE